MKTLKNLIAVIALLVFVTSCQKDEFQNDHATDRVAQEDLSGESMDANKITQAEFEYQTNAITKQISSKKVDLKDIRMTKDYTRGEKISPLYCGDAITGNTQDETSTVDIYQGPDKVYLLEVDSRTDVEINLSDMAGDLDLYLTTIEVDQFGQEQVGQVIANSLNYGTDNEYVTASLDPGRYWVIVETFDGATLYGIVVSCAIVGTPVSIACEDYDNLQCSYNYGVSTQTEEWTKWSSRSRDGLVLNEGTGIENKVVKFDAGRFGAQDAVRSLMNNAITSDVVKMSWDMYIPSYKRADFVTEKTGLFGQEQGQLITLENGQVTAKSGLAVRKSNTRYISDEWIKIEMIFDMKAKMVYTTIAEQIQIVSGADAKVGQSTFGINSIFGVDFYNRAYHSKFNIDNVCVEVMENSVDPATFQKPFSEYMDLRIL